MTPQELKNSILQLAIQGRLVEQRPEEGTAEELYRQIQREKAALVKAGKIKKEKPLPEIMEEEVPFEIPEGWKWVRLAEIWSILNGDRGKNYPSKETLSKTGIPFISALNLDGRTVIEDDKLLCLSQQQYDKLGNGKLIQGDIVVCIRGSLGKHGRYPFEKGAIASSLVIMRLPLHVSTLDDYLMWYLDTPLFFSEIKKYDNGTAQPNLAAKSLEQFLIPLPPLAEQKRIVAKIEELLPYIDRYEAAWSRLEVFNKRFPTDMQKSILQLAIQGKLVPQRPEEGTGDELYQQIVEKRSYLEQCKLIKRQSVSDSNEGIPFEIPQSWKWIRIGSVEEINLGFTYRPEYVETGVYFLSVKDITDGKIDFSNAKKVSVDTYSNAAYGSKPQRGDILFGRVGTMGKPQIVETDDPFCIFVSLGFFRDHLDILNKKYVCYWMQTKSFDDQVCANVKGSAQKNLNTGWLKNFWFPLPPIDEQNRIVAKLEELLPLCERLK